MSNTLADRNDSHKPSECLAGKIVRISFEGIEKAQSPDEKKHKTKGAHPEFGRSSKD